MSDNEVVTNLKVLDESIENCSACATGKGRRSNFRRQTTLQPKAIFEYISYDTEGPITPAASGGFTYAIGFICQYSGFSTWYLMKHKSEAMYYIIKYIDTIVKRKRQYNITLHSDNAPEFKSKELIKELDKRNITISKTPSYTPQRNGKKERENLTILNMVRAMIDHSGLPKRLWGEGVLYAVQIRNNTTTSKHPKQTAHQLIEGSSSDMKHFRVFGSRVYYSNNKYKKKLEPRKILAYYTGWSTQHHCYKVWDPELNSIILSRDVTFHESFLYKENAPVNYEET
eukprot:Pgem_evm1s3763